LQAYIAAGIDSCHETTSPEDALAKLRAGMWVQFREGSTFQDVAALAPVLTENGVDSRHCLLVTDDVHPETIVSEGHLDRAVRRASGTVTTEHRILEAPVTHGEVRSSAELDLVKLASIERHGGPGTVGLGFVTGLGLKRGAVGSSVAHDSHNLLVAGLTDDEMLFAIEQLERMGGGMIAVAGRDVLGLVELPIAGLMSDRPVLEVAEQTRRLGEAYLALGSQLESPYMLFSFLSLGVIPELRLTNHGLVDGVTFTLVP